MNLTEFNIDYLEALMTEDTPVIDRVEEDAYKEGYSPRAPCKYTCPASAQHFNCCKCGLSVVAWVCAYVSYSLLAQRPGD